MTNERRIAYIYNKSFIGFSDDYIPTTSRNIMVHSLLDACNLLNKMTSITPVKAKYEDLALFHAMDYLQFLKDENKWCDDDLATEYGFVYDCPLKAGVHDYCLEIGGGSITGASALCRRDCDVVFHWLGGWHHAKRNEAAGYCYVNDCVLAILHLRKTFSKVLYVDLDLHHGDGVQDAFSATDKVMTFSVHKYEPGFFPGTGSIDDIGFGKGRYYSVNLPLRDGIRDEEFINACQKILNKIKIAFKPQAVVCQVGADGLNEDPMRSFNLTAHSLIKTVNHVLSWNLPTLVLGGGGYHEANVARCWCSVTASVLGVDLPEEIPEHDFFPNYGPDFEFKIAKSFKKDLNTPDYLDKVISTVMSNLDKL